MHPNSQAILNALIGKHYTEFFNFLCQANSRAVYNWIQVNYNNPFPVWMPGFEAAPDNRNKMAAFLSDKALHAESTAQYLTNLFKAIPVK